MLFVSQDFFENHKHPLLVFDAHTAKILKANTATSRYFDRSDEDVLQATVDDLLKTQGCTLDWRDPAFGDRSDFHISDVTFEDAPAKVLTITGPPSIDGEKELPRHQPTNATGDTSTQERPDILAARLRQTEKLANIGHWEVDIATMRVHWSGHNSRIFGIDPADFDHDFRNVSSLVHSDDREAYDNQIENVLANRQAYASVHKIRRSDGEVRYVREVGEISNSGTGNTFYGITQDVTDLWSAQAAAEKAEELLRDAGTIAKVGGWEYNVRTGVVTRSPVVAQIVGTPDQRFIQLDQARKLYTEDYNEKHKTIWRDCISEGKPFDEVMELISVQNVRKWVRISGKPIWDAEKKQVLGIRGALQDISDIVEARRKSEAMSTSLKETMDGISDSFMVINRQWEVVFSNASASQLMGLSHEQMVGKSVWKLFPDAVGSEFYKKYHRLMAEGGTQRFVARSPISGKWLAISAYSSSQGLAISARDITSEYEKDEQLRLLETAVAKLNDAVVISQVTEGSDPAHPNVIFANNAFERITGYRSDEVIGSALAFLRGPDTQTNELTRIEKAMKDAVPVRSELTLYTKAGQPIWMDLDIVPIKRANGEVSHWVSIKRDATDRKLAEQRIRLSEERFRLVAEASNDVIWDCDLQSGQMWWNDQLLAVFGHDASQFSDKLNWWDANLHPDEQEDILCRMQQIIGGHDNTWDLRYRFARADGTYAHVIDRGAILRDTNGVATRIVGNMSDVTEQVEIEEQLRHAQKLEAIGKLTGGVAHDFNNLLAIVMGNLELLKEEIPQLHGTPYSPHEYIDAGISAVKRGADLTNKMLAYARKARLNPVETDLNKTVHETTSWVRRTIETNIDIQTVLSDPLNLTLLDANSLQNAMLNLLVNARDALPDGGTIVVETSNLDNDDPRVAQLNLPHTESGFVMLSISDNGPGISEPDMHQIFDPFFTTKPVGKGSGLGLSMVQGFVDQSKGAVRVFSEVGRGTHVELFFQAVETQNFADLTPPAPDNFLPDPIKPYHAPGKILLVEDDPHVRQMLTRTLQKNRFDVVSAENGDAALALFRADPVFDLVLTDVSMPGKLQGYALGNACRAFNPEIPIIFLSGHVHESSIEDDIDIPDGLRLIKPVSSRELLAAVQSYMMASSVTAQ